MRKIYRYIAVLLSVLFFMQNPMVAYAFLSPGEIVDFYKNFFSYCSTQLGTFFSGSMQEVLLQDEAFSEWSKDRYKNGYDGSAVWNQEDYFTKECIRNPDGTFTFSDRMVDDFVAYTKEVLDANSGYYLLKTKSVKNISPAEFYSKKTYNNFVSLFDTHKIIYLWYDEVLYPPNVLVEMGSVGYGVFDEYLFAFPVDLKGNAIFDRVCLYSNEWVRDIRPQDYSIHDDGVVSPGGGGIPGEPSCDDIYTKNGDYIRIYKNEKNLKEQDAGHQPYYVGDKFLNYDSSQDNSITVDEDTFNNTNWSSTNSSYYNDISNTVINNNYGGTGDSSSGGMTEEQLRQIVNDLMSKIEQDSGGKDDPGGSGGSGTDPGGTGDDPGGTGGSGGGIGAGIAAILEGLAKLLDFLLAVIGKLVGVLADFLTKAVDLLGGLSGFTAPFANLMEVLMPFIPSELWDVILAGIVLSVIAAVVKAFKG